MAAAAICSTPRPTPETIRAIVAAHRRFGTTALAPTVITDAPEVLASALEAAREDIPGSLGVHAEGPFIDPRRKGAHPERHIRVMTDADARRLVEARARVVTLAPASVSLELIRRLAENGVVVSLGHSDASAEEARACFDAGVRTVTHLYNAMSQLGSRAPGIVGAALEDPRIYAGFIADGLHAHETAGRLAYRLKGSSRLALISDAMPPAAGGPDSYDLGGRTVRREGLRLTLEDGTLAGAVDHHARCRALRRASPRRITGRCAAHGDFDARAASAGGNAARRPLGWRAGGFRASRR